MTSEDNYFKHVEYAYGWRAFEKMMDWVLEEENPFIWGAKVPLIAHAGGPCMMEAICEGGVRYLQERLTSLHKWI